MTIPADQHLHARTTRSVAACVADAFGATGTAPNADLSLIARRAGHRFGDIDAAVRAGEVTRLRALRGSVQTVPAADLPMLLLALGPRVGRAQARLAIGAGIDQDRLRSAVEAVVGSVRDAGTSLSTTDVADTQPALPRPAISRLLHVAASLGWLVRGPDAGTWRTDRPTWNTPDRQIRSTIMPDVPWWSVGGTGATDDVDDRIPGHRDALVDLAVRHVRAYAPVTFEDTAWWLGIPRRRLDDVWEQARERLALHRRRDGTPTWVLREQRAARADDVPVGVRLLPVWDQWSVVGPDRRSRTAASVGSVDGVDPATLTHDRQGNAGPVLLVDGVVGGQWTLDVDARVDVRVAVLPTRLPAGRLGELRHEASLVARAVAEVTARPVGRLLGCDPVPLAETASRPFRAPLRDQPTSDLGALDA